MNAKTAYRGSECFIMFPTYTDGKPTGLVWAYMKSGFVAIPFETRAAMRAWVNNQTCGRKSQ